MIPKLLRRLLLNHFFNLIAKCAVNAAVVDVDAHSPDKQQALKLWWTGTYTLNGTGDNLDLSPANGLNPDGSSRNPSNIPGAFPTRQPTIWADNGGDMNGAYFGIVQGADLHSWKIKFYQANGNELATNAAYPAGTPGTLAASQVLLFIGGKVNLF